MASVLSADRFTAIATEGLGRKSTTTAASMAYFRGAIFVGTSCLNPLARGNAPRVLRYDVERGAWETAYESPLIDAATHLQEPDRKPGQDGAAGPQRRERLPAAAIVQKAIGRIPRDSGYRSMCVFQGKSDPRPALYVSTMSRSGAILLRSNDGEVFEQVSEPGLGDPSVYSFRALAEMNGYLFASPAGTVAGSDVDRNLATDPKVYVSDDPRKGKWLNAAGSGFGNASNRAIYSLYPAFDRMYAGTANPDLGCQLWQTAALGKPPFDWSPVIINGGDGFNRNFASCAMAEFRGALYVGVGVTGLGYERAHDIGPASGELWRVYPDGRWDLIAGQTRFSPYGLKVPLSRLGPGLGDFYNARIQALVAHNGVLYLGTFQWESYRCVEIESSDIVGGYQLWGSDDGAQWTPVLEDGNGNPADFGIASLLSTPHGLFVGTSNQCRLLSNLSLDREAKLDFPQGFEVLLGR